MDAADFDLADYDPPAIAIPAEPSPPPKWELVPEKKKSHAFRDREIAYQVLSAIDAGQTIYCLKRIEGCYEMNPIYGKHPPTKKVIGVKLVDGVLHYLVSEHLKRRDPGLAKAWQVTTIVVQGGFVAWNMHVIF